MIEISIDTKQLEAKLSKIKGGRGLKYAVAMAITWTAKDCAEGLRSEIQGLDRPTPGALRAARFTPASADKTAYFVYLQDQTRAGTAPAEYLEALTKGGRRKDKPHEKRLRQTGILPPGLHTTPGFNAPRDRYGNLGGGRYQSILSGLSAYRGERVERLNRSARSRGQRNYFVVPGSGIFERRGGNLINWLRFIRPANYTKQLSIKPKIERIFHARFEAHYREGLERMLIKSMGW